MDNGILSSLIGGGLALSGVVATLVYENHAQKKRLEFERKCRQEEKYENLYAELAGVLNSLEISIIPVDDNRITINTEYFEEQLEKMSAVLEKNQGVSALYLPHSILRELIHLQSDIYQMVSSPDPVDFDYKDIKNCKAYQIVIQAKTIVSHLKQELR